MKDLELQLAQDRALRDAAKAVIQADIAFLKEDLAPSALTSRMADGATEVFDRAKDVAEDNKGILGTLVAAVILWFARNPILDLLAGDRDDEQHDEAPEHNVTADRSDAEH
jgi:hypothetical protein